MIKTIVILLSLCWGFSDFAQNHEVCGTAQLDNLRKGLIIQDSTLVDGMVVYSMPDEPAQFVGGNSAMFNFIRSTINYPPMDIHANDQKVYTRITVLKDGSISDVSVIRGAADYPECDTEAIRVIKLMPKWIPATVNGQPVDSQLYLPVRFRAYE